MKSYHILECSNQQKIADSLYGYYVGITANRELKEFWNHLSRKEIQDYFSIPNNPCKEWFDSSGLKVRDMSFMETLLKVRSIMGLMQSKVTQGDARVDVIEWSMAC